MSNKYPRGTVLLAKPHHPIRTFRGGDGIAVVSDDNSIGSVMVYWVNGDPGSHMAYDMVGRKWVESWFDIIPQEEHHKHLPADFVMPKSVEDIFEGDDPSEIYDFKDAL